MADRVVDRRMLLRGAGVAGATVIGGTALGSSAAAADRDNRDGSVTGAWVITHRDNPPAQPSPGTSVIAFADGGVFIAQDIAPFAPGGLGAWSHENGDRVKADFWTGFPSESGSPAVALNIKARGEVHHDTISGTYTFTVRSARNLKKVLQRGTGKFRGHRLET